MTSCPGEVSLLNRNVSIVVIILVLVVIAGYLIWLRSKVVPSVSPNVEQTQVTPAASASAVASPSATPAKEATGSVKQKTSTPGATGR